MQAVMGPVISITVKCQTVKVIAVYYLFDHLVELSQMAQMS